ncbi:MAG: right-handed parallel beta-helix repeat-containing protein, partial [Saprospiraceae bacterium]|nr:right-handed parallel beta-helix repeat-containing protein [Saprospiraceae bacterium]
MKNLKGTTMSIYLFGSKSSVNCPQHMSHNNNSFSKQQVGIVIVILAFVCSLIGTNFTHAFAAGATTYYVDKTNASCSDTGIGTTATLPFCKISKGASSAVAGDTVRVLAGSYAETVTIPKSGSAGLPITYSAAPGVIITGNGLASGGSAFRISTKSYIIVDGFNVNSTADNGIYVSTSNHITISNNHVSYSGKTVSGFTRAGIYLSSTTNSSIINNIVDHNSQDGIRLTTGAVNNVVSNNISFANAEKWQRNATGIQVYGSSSYNNYITYNTTYANEDSGLQFYNMTHNNFVIGNLTYGNGDHGIDFVNSPNNTVISNTVQGNHTAGINLEGSATPGSSGAKVINNISVDNGIAPITGQKSNIRVDTSSVPGTTIDYNLVYLTSSGTVQIQWDRINYSSLAAFKAAVPGQELHGIQANPLFILPVAPATRPPALVVGNYHLQAGSPVIDSANADAASESVTDLDGHFRIDDPATINTGLGVRTYDDRGAYEFQLVNETPTYTPTMILPQTSTNTPTATFTLTHTPNNTPTATVTNTSTPVSSLTPTSTFTPVNTSLPPTETATQLPTATSTTVPSGSVLTFITDDSYVRENAPNSNYGSNVQ